MTNQMDLSEAERVALSRPPMESWLPYFREVYIFFKGMFFSYYFSLDVGGNALKYLNSTTGGKKQPGCPLTKAGRETTGQLLEAVASPAQGHSSAGPVNLIPGKIFLGEVGEQRSEPGPGLSHTWAFPPGPASLQGAAPAAFPTGPVLHRDF